jgi:hypothetical protein
MVGTYRSGTTSLFRYLSDHPQVAPSSLKETGYFLPVDEPAPSRWGVGGRVVSPTLRMGRDPLERYFDLFEPSRRAVVRVEATPTYLYNRASAEAIAAALPGCRILITLRDPMRWVVSCYKLFVALRVVEQPFDEWVQRQHEDRQELTARPFQLRTLEHGNFAPNVAMYREVFGAEHVQVVYFEHLVAQPKDCLASVARFAGIDPGVYENYAFTNVNPVRRFRRDSYYDRYEATRSSIASVLAHAPAVLRSGAARLERWAYPRYEAWATEPVRDPVLGPKTRQLLVERYREVSPELTTLLGVAPPWRTQTGNGGAAVS